MKPPQGPSHNPSSVETPAQAERRLRALMQKATELFALVDAAGIITCESPNQEAVLGFPPGELLGRSAFELLHPEDRAVALAGFQEVLGCPGHSRHIEARVQTRSGQWRWLDIVGTNFLDDPAIRGVALNVRDITERRLLEEQLQAERDLFRLILENTLEAIYRRNLLTGCYDYFSPSVERLTGFRPEELIGCSVVHTLDRIHPDDREQARQIVQQAEREAAASGYAEYRYLHRDGTYRWFADQFKVVRDPATQQLYWIGAVRDITERKLAQEAAAAAERRWQQTFDAVGDAIWVLDSGGRVLVCNRTACEMFGMSAERMIGRLCCEILHGSRQPVSGCPLQRMLESRRREELELQRGDRWYRITVDPSLDSGGRLTGAVHIVSDITEWKRAEQALRQAEELYRKWLDAIPMLAWQCNPKGEAQICNARWYEYTGEPPERTLGNLWQNALHPDDRERIARETIRCAETGDPYHVEYRLRRHDGQYRWHLARAVPVRDRRGNIVMWVGCAADIEEHKRLQHALRDSEQRFRELTNLVPQHIWISEPNGRPVYANQQRVEYTGINLPQAQLAHGWWQAVHPDDQPLVRQVQQRALAQGEPHQWEYRLRCAATGQYRWFLGRVVPLKDAQGRVERWLCTATDIDEQKCQEEILERRVKARTAQLEREMGRRHRLEEQLIQITERLQSDIGRELHDGVGQHLTAAKFLGGSLCHRLARSGAPAAQTAQELVRQLDQALEELRSVARGLHPVKAGAESLMAALYELAENTHKLYGIACQLDCPRPVRVQDSTVAIHLYRIAQEAVNNAVRHANPQHIIISLHQDEEQVRLKVLDDGRGLPPPSRRRAGLGLETMKYRAELIGADFRIRRRRTGGTEVCCTWRPPPKGAEHAR